jgi:hypothetical protein
MLCRLFHSTEDVEKILVEPTNLCSLIGTLKIYSCAVFALQFYGMCSILLFLHDGIHSSSSQAIPRHDDEESSVMSWTESIRPFRGRNCEATPLCRSDCAAIAAQHAATDPSMSRNTEATRVGSRPLLYRTHLCIVGDACVGESNRAEAVGRSAGIYINVKDEM